jgi:hypothetical protein
VDLGAVQADGPKTAELVLAGDLQHLHKGRFEFLGEAPPEGGQGIVVRMAVGGNDTSRSGRMR